VTEEEILAAARNSPPPELMQSPEFQTDGRPDLGKWQRYLATASRDFKLLLEAQYRDAIPQIKLQQYLTADVYVSDAVLWRTYRDRHDSVRIALLPLFAAAMPDTGVTVTDDELRRYLREHEDDYRRPAVAFLSYVALDRRPDAADSAAALARARAIRAEAARDSATFGRLAREVSADSATAEQGGELGWIAWTDSRLDPAVTRALRALRPGQVSPPVLTDRGHEIVRLEAARGDSVRARRIVIPVELVDEHLDHVESRADTLDMVAADQTEPQALDRAAEQLGLVVGRSRLREGERLTLGGDVVPNVSVWAFETPVGEISAVFEGPAAYYVFRLDSLQRGGVPPLAQIRDAVAAAVRHEKKRELAARRAQALAPELRAAPSLNEFAARHDLRVQRLGPFTRVSSPPLLQREPLVLGAAFGLTRGERAGPVPGELGHYFIEVLSHKPADSQAWVAQKVAQRSEVLLAARQARIAQYVSGLRASAQIVDRRRELARQAAQAAPAPAVPLY
jgi:parvulin-like peptidyl-prolyl isomerase